MLDYILSDWRWLKFIFELILFSIAMEFGAFLQRKRDKDEFTWTCPREDCTFFVGSNSAEMTLAIADSHEEVHDQ